MLLKNLSLNAILQCLSLIYSLLFTKVALSVWGVDTYSYVIVMVAYIGFLNIAELGIPTTIQNFVILKKNEYSKTIGSALINVACLINITVIGIIAAGIFVIELISIQNGDQKIFRDLLISGALMVDPALAIILFVQVILGVLQTFANIHLCYQGKYQLTIKIAIFLRVQEVIALGLLGYGYLSPISLFLILASLKLISVLVTASKFMPYYQDITLKVIKGIRSELALIQTLRKQILGYALFPAGFLIRNQGFLVVAASALSPLETTMYATSRTLVNISYQIMGLFNNSYHVHISQGIRERNYSALMVEINKTCMKLSMIMLCLTTALMIFIDYVYENWVGLEYLPTKGFLFILFIDVLIHTIWGFRTMILVAGNTAARLALHFTVSNAISFLLYLIILVDYSLIGVGVSLLLPNIYMIIIHNRLISSS